jgi:acetoin utilization deacetylase AcuC-like enzyme
MKPTAVYRDTTFLLHDPGAAHVESPRRLEAIYASLDAEPVPGCTTLAPRAATAEEIRRVHDAAYVERLSRTAGAAHTRLDVDTATSADSYDAALRAAGATVQAVEAVVAGEAHGAFALVRPPGHHAESDRAMGFCLFNNVAVAAAHAAEVCGLSRVLVLDPDVHHGNGTQHAFEDSKAVLYASSHRYPFYPGTGALHEIGKGDGEGYTVNLPLPPDGGDADLLHVYTSVVDPIVEAFAPELILVSAGFDTWQDDPLGGMRVTARGFAAFFALVRRWADRHCPGRIVCTLEGGYDPAGLVVGVREALSALTAETAAETEVEGSVAESTRACAAAARRLLDPLWGSTAGR